MKVLVTGSHFTPAQAVIEKLLEIPDIEIVYLGRKYARDDDKALSVESKILPKLGVKFIPITAGKLNRFLSLQTIISFLKTPIGFIQSFYYLLKEKPDLIISFGGFTGMPVVINGWLLSVPSLIHEQSLKMGLSNLISSIFANKVALTFSETKVPGFLNPKKITVTGNPIRKEFLEKALPSKEILNFVEQSNKPLILITAGNQGSHFINLTVEDKLTELTKKYCLIHQTGDSRYDDFSNLSKHQSNNYLVKKWIEASDLSFILDKVDLVISRAGINTLSELALKEVLALIIPIPVGSEQRKNAHYFVSVGLGETIEEKKLSPNILISKIHEMLNKKNSYKLSVKKAKQQIIMDGEKRLVQEMLLLKNLRDNYDLNF